MAFTGNEDEEAQSAGLIPHGPGFEGRWGDRVECNSLSLYMVTEVGWHAVRLSVMCPVC